MDSLGSPTTPQNTVQHLWDMKLFPAFAQSLLKGCPCFRMVFASRWFLLPDRFCFQVAPAFRLLSPHAWYTKLHTWHHGLCMDSGHQYLESTVSECTCNCNTDCIECGVLDLDWISCHELVPRHVSCSSSPMIDCPYYGY